MESHPLSLRIPWDYRRWKDWHHSLSSCSRTEVLFYTDTSSSPPETIEVFLSKWMCSAVLQAK